MRRLAAIGAVFMLVATGTLYADGKMYWSERIPPTIPYQRALIGFRDGTETLVLHSNYALPQAASDHPLGWVVPVPAVPEVATMPAWAASHLFGRLDGFTRPHVTRIGPICLASVGIGQILLRGYMLNHRRLKVGGIDCD